MKKQFVTYKIALALKELGFDEKCFGWYDNEGRFFFPSNNTLHTRNSKVEGRSDNIITAPLWQQVIDWLREEYNIYINVLPITFDTEPTFIFEIISLKNGELLNNIDGSFLDVNEAREQSILDTINQVE